MRCDGYASRRMRPGHSSALSPSSSGTLPVIKSPRGACLSSGSSARCLFLKNIISPAHSSVANMQTSPHSQPAYTNTNIAAASSAAAASEKTILNIR